MNQLTRKTIIFCKENKIIFAKIYIPFLFIFTTFNLISQKLFAKMTKSISSVMQEITENMSFGNSLNELISAIKNELPLLLIIAMAIALVKFIYNCLIISKIAENDDRLHEKPHFPSFAALFTTFLLYELMRRFGFALFVIPGIILSFFLLMVPCVLIMENKTNFVSFDRSFFIIKKDAMNVIYAVLIMGLFYLGMQFVFSLILSLIRTILNGIITILSLSAVSSISSNIFMFLDVFINSALYAAFSICIQSMLYIHYTEQINQPESDNQTVFEEQRYTLDDYYRGKEEPDDDEK